MTEHIETRRKLKNKPLVKDLESLFSACALSDEERKIMQMHYIKHKDFRYIADTIGYKENSVVKIHRRILKKISAVV